MSRVDGPVPRAEVEAMAVRTLLWPRAEDALAGHPAHLISAALDGAERPLDAAHALTRIIGAVAAGVRVAGAYWASADQLVQPSRLIEAAMAEQPPVEVWLGMMPFQGDPSQGWAAGSFGVLTRGLGALAGYELMRDAMATGGALEPVLEEVWGLARYLLATGAALEAGQVIDGLPGGKVRVEAAARPDERGTPVLRLARVAAGADA